MADGSLGYLERRRMRAATIRPLANVCTIILTRLVPQSRFGGKPLKLRVACAQNGSAVLNGLIPRVHVARFLAHMHRIYRPRTVTRQAGQPAVRKK